MPSLKLASCSWPPSPLLPRPPETNYTLAAAWPHLLGALDNLVSRGARGRGLGPAMPLTAIVQLTTDTVDGASTLGIRGPVPRPLSLARIRTTPRCICARLRRRALCLVLQQGLSQAQAAQAVGVQRQTVNIWLQRHRAQGQDALLDGRRVSPRRGKGLLTAAEAGQIQGWLCDRRFNHVQGPFALWTNQAVRDLIDQRFGKRLGLTTVQLYLQRWGMTPQQPLAQAKERSPTAVAAWLATTYPAIAKRARAEGAVIYWGATTKIAQQDQSGRADAPAGQAPVAGSARRITLSMSAAFSNRGVMSFMLRAGPFKAAHFLEFLRRLRADAGQEARLRRVRQWRRRPHADPLEMFEVPPSEARDPKVFLIVDHRKVYHADKVKAWVAAHAHEIELYHLPP